MRKRLSLLLCALLLCDLLAGCGAAGAAEPAGGAPDIVVTVFPAYDWVLNILGERAGDFNVRMLLDKGVDLHSYQPSVDDIIRISTCDLFVYVGGESDEWVEDALRQAANADMRVVKLMDVLRGRLREEELVEGMEAEEEEEESAYDEHVWLSLRNAEAAVAALAEQLAQLEPENGAVYAANAAAYTERLRALDGEYRTAVEEAAVKTLLFADRFPFRYLTEDYGLRYYAAFAGCSAETEASFETVRFLADKADELGLRAVLTIEGGDGRIAETVTDAMRSGGAQILSLDSMQAVSAEDAAAGESYLGIMEKNLAVLKIALG